MVTYLKEVQFIWNFAWQDKNKMTFYTPVLRRAVLCDWVWWAGVHTGFRTITLVLDIRSLPNLATWFPCGRGRTVVRNSIYSNGDLDLWPNDPKINRGLPLPQGNHVAKFGKDPIYRTKVIVRKQSCRSKVKVTITINIIFDNRVVSAW
jgi:hypothetical protein